MMNSNLDISLETQNIFGSLPNVLMNAAGASCSSMEELNILSNPLESRNSAFISKSCTFNYREGNPHPRYYHEGGDSNKVPLFSINSTGLANQGHQAYLDFGKIYHMKEKEIEKPYVISVAGLSQTENLEIIHNIVSVKDTTICSAIELNLSCPNVIGKPQIGYDFDASHELLRKLFEQDGEMVGTKYPLGLKLPPYFDLIHYHQMVNVISDFPISFVTCINSLGNGLVVDWESESCVIKPKGGFGGIGGHVVKPIALANVHKFKQLLPDMMVIGCGGVRSGKDVFEHLLVGAEMVQVGTQFVVEGKEIFSRLNLELKHIMKMKGYSRISDFRGKLKEI